jgi:transcriptional regulator with XRE-family HTH domain
VGNRGPLPVDVLVGQNIRSNRLHRQLSQGDLGQQIGLSYQQIQKYETGANRVGASRLRQLAEVLDVPLPTLFDGRRVVGRQTPQQPVHLLLAKPDALRILRAFDRIEDGRVRLAVVHLVDCIAGTSSRQGQTRRKRVGSQFH